MVWLHVLFVVCCVFSLVNWHFFFCDDRLSCEIQCGSVHSVTEQSWKFWLMGNIINTPCCGLWLVKCNSYLLWHHLGNMWFYNFNVCVMPTQTKRNKGKTQQLFCARIQFWYADSIWLQFAIRSINVNVSSIFEKVRLPAWIWW